MCHGFQEVTWHTTFFNSHARKMEKSINKEENMDLSKAFDTLNHDLLLAKLKSCGFSKQALSFMCSYLKNRRQRVQINNTFSSLKEVIAGVLQGSIDEPLFFNLFIDDYFFSFVLVL